MNLNSFIIDSNDVAITNPRKFNDSVALRYQEHSKYDKFSFLQESGNIHLFATPYVSERVSHPYKRYASKQKISLSEYGKFEMDTLQQTINNRRSCRSFQNYNLSLNELYKILHFSYGITGGAPLLNSDGWWNYRAVPSGGALYPLEIYIYLHQSSLPRGLYHYFPETDSLDKLYESDLIKKINNTVAAGNLNIGNSSAVVFITSMFQRNMIKYGERGYRFILQEVGFVEENMSLICQDLNLASCMLGGYLDDEINKLLEISPPLETIQGLMIIGKKTKQATINNKMK